MKKNVRAGRLRVRLLGIAVSVALSLPLVLAGGQSEARQQRSLHMTVAGQPLTFEAAEGYCVLDEGEEVDRLLFEMMARMLGPKNPLIGIFIGCDDYQALHDGTIEELGRYAVVMLPGGGDGANPRKRGARREQVIRQFAELYSSEAFRQHADAKIRQHVARMDVDNVLLADLFDDEGLAETAADREVLETMKADILAGRMNFFPMGSDDAATYVGYAVPLDGMTQAGVGAVTLINELPVQIVFYDGPASVDLYDELKQEAHAMVKRAIFLSEAR